MKNVSKTNLSAVSKNGSSTNVGNYGSPRKPGTKAKKFSSGLTSKEGVKKSSMGSKKNGDMNDKKLKEKLEAMYVKDPKHYTAEEMK